MKTPFILNLTPKTPTPSPLPFSTKNTLVYPSIFFIFDPKIGYNGVQKIIKKSYTIVYFDPKNDKTAGFSIKNLQILETF